MGEGAGRLGIRRDLVGGVQPGIEDAGQDLLIELVLGVEIIVQIGLGNSGAPGDLRRRGAVEAGLGKDGFRSLENVEVGEVEMKRGYRNVAFLDCAKIGVLAA